MVKLRHSWVLVSLVVIANLSFLCSAARQSQQQMAGQASVMIKSENIDLMKKQAAERSAGGSRTSATSNPSDAERLDGYTDEARDDFVTYLPGWGDVRDFNLFAGCV